MKKLFVISLILLLSSTLQAQDKELIKAFGTQIKVDSTWTTDYFKLTIYEGERAYLIIGNTGYFLKCLPLSVGGNRFYLKNRRSQFIATFTFDESRRRIVKLIDERNNFEMTVLVREY